MPKGSSVIQTVHIADGFADDCDELINRCMQVDNLNYHIFCNLWKDMNMACLFKERPIACEVAELSDEVVLIAKRYIVTNSFDIKEAVAGLFLVYALLSLQPFPGFAQLRIVPEDLPALKRLERVARDTKRYDVLYILGKVLIEHSQYHAAERERGLERSLRGYLDGHTSIDSRGVRSKGVFYRQNEELDMLRELNTLTKRYKEAKEAVREPGSLKPDRSLAYTDDTLFTSLHDSLKSIINGTFDEDQGTNSDDGHGSSVQAIKDKAMRTKVDTMKHLQAVCDKDSSPQQQKKCSPINKKGKIKDKKDSAKKETIKSPRKKRLQLAGKRPGSVDSASDEDIPAPTVPTRSTKKRKLPTSKKKKVSSDSSDSEISVHLEDDDLSDVDLSNFNKEIEVQNKMIDVEIQSLPVVIRSEDKGNSYEVEIIDNVASGSGGKGSDVKSEKETNNIRSVRRKNVAIQSKLKKMGMMDVAGMGEHESDSDC